MAVTEYRQSILQAPHQTLTCTVNCCGAMGKGVALAFRKAVPGLLQAYQRDCSRGRMQLDTLHVYPWREQRKQILAFPTKFHWSEDSSVDQIARLLRTLVRIYDDLGITSLALPPLGCGNGRLLYEAEVRDVMYEYLSELNIEVGIYLGD